VGRLSLVVMALGCALATGLAGQRVAAEQGEARPAGRAGDAGQFSCDASDKRLRACFTFDGDTKDRSSFGNHANSAHVSYVPGKGGQALHLGPNSRVLVAQHPSLDLTAMTIKFWIRPTAFPTGDGRMGIIDGEATYRMYVHENGIIRCSLTGRPEAYTKVGIPLNQWTRIACTFDGSVMRIHINGEPAVEVKQAGKIAASIASLALGHDFPSGDNLIGDLDQLEVWDAIVAP
jgi:Concanavalin A-like lectin/glucanases superfamily